MSTTDLSSHIAGEIRAGAARKRMSLDEVAEAAGIKRATFYRRMAGRSDFTLPELLAVCQVVDLAFASLWPEDAA